MADRSHTVEAERQGDAAPAQVDEAGARPKSLLGAASASMGASMLQRKLARRRTEGSAVQRKVGEGWGTKSGWNSGAHTVGPNGERDPASGGVQRLPLDGLPKADFPTGKAIVAVSPQVSLPDARSVDVMVHFHGWGPGYFGGRDVSFDNIEQQLAAAGRPMIAVLPQLAANAEVSQGSPGQEQAFDAARIAATVFSHLRTREPPLMREDQTLGRVIESGHSAGGRAATKTATADAKARPDAAGGLFLFDGHVNFSAVQPLLAERLGHDHAQMVGDPAHPAMNAAQQLAYLNSRGFVFRAFGHGGGYTEQHARKGAKHGSAQEADYVGGGHGGPQGVDGDYGGRTQRLSDYLDEYFADSKNTAGVEAAALTRWRQNYRATAKDGGDSKGAKPDHETMVSHGDGAANGHYLDSNKKTGRQGHLEQALHGNP